MTRPAVLFVCLGNICRSPLAEAAFRAEAKRAGLAVAIGSGGTSGEHAGDPPDARAVRTAAKFGHDIAGYRARKISGEDFDRYTHIFALDHANLAALQRLAPAGHNVHLALLLDVVPGLAGRSVADPYYGTEADFAVTWEEVALAARHLVMQLAVQAE